MVRRRVHWKTAALILISCVVIAAVLVGIHSLQADRGADLFLTKAREASDAEDYPEAVRAYRSYLRLVPTSTEAHAELGRLLYDQGVYDDALQEFEVTLRLNPNDVGSRRRAARSALVMGRASDAQDHLARLPEEQHDAEFHEWRGQCHRADRQFADASDSFNKAIALDPNRLEAYVLLSLMLNSDLDQPDEAEVVLHRMVVANPDSATAFQSYGQFLQTRARRAEASGDLAIASQKNDAALDALRKAFEIDPNNASVLLLLATSERTQGSLDEAQAHAEASQSLTPENPGTYLLLADLAKQQGNEASVEQWLREGITRVSKDDLTGRDSLRTSLAHFLLDLGKEEESVGVIQELRATNSSPSMLTYLEGRLDALRGDWDAACEKLESIRPAFVNQANVAPQIDLLLGQGYRELGSTELAIASLRRTIAAEPGWHEPRMVLVGILESNGQADAALEELRQLMKLPSAPGNGWLLLAQRSYLATLRVEPDQRDWTLTTQLLNRAAEALPDRLEVPMLVVAVLVAQGKTEEADNFLQGLLDQTPAEQRDRRIAISTARSALAQTEENWDLAEQILDQADEEYGADVSLVLARGSYLIRRDGDDTEDALRQLAASSDGYSGDDLRRLRLGIGGLALQIGATDLSGKLIQQLSSETTEPDIELVRLELDQALLSKDDQRLEEVLTQLKELSGEDEFWHFGQARLLLSRGDMTDSETLDQAIAHLVEAERRSPGWSQPIAIRAELMLRKGDMDSAIAAMTKAADLGTRTPAMLQQNIQLLFERQRFREADRLIRMVDGEQGSELEGMARISSAVSAGLNDFDRALDLARQSAKESSDYRDHLWLAQLTSLLSFRGDSATQEQFREESEQAFRSALEYGNDQPQPWIEFVRFLSANDRQEDLTTALTTAESKIKPELKDAAMASCYEILGRMDDAAAAHQKAVQRDPSNEQVVRQAIEFELRQNRTASAQQRLEGMIASAQTSDANVQWARRTLAISKSMQGGRTNLDDAAALIEENLKSPNPNPDDLRAKAFVLMANKTAESRRQSIDALRRIVGSNSDAKPSDQYQLSQLLRAEGKWNEAAGYLRGAIAGASDQQEQATYISAYVSGLLDNEEFSDAKLWLRRLEQVDSAGTASANLQARLLSQTGQHAEAVALLKQSVNASLDETSGGQNPSETQTAGQMMQSALQLESLAALAKPEDRDIYIESAENFYRQAAALDRGNRIPLAYYYIRQGKTDQAIELLEESEILQPEYADVLGLVERSARSAKFNSTQLERVDLLVENIAAAMGRTQLVLSVKASILTAMGDGEGVNQIYREILEQDPDNVIALNNLAVGLGKTETGIEEAIKLSDRAIQVRGRYPAILDTRGVLAIEAGDYKLAAKLMQEVTSQSELPIYLLHRAVAELRLGKTDQALAGIANIDFDLGLLDDRDQAWLAELQAARDQQE